MTATNNHRAIGLRAILAGSAGLSFAFALGLRCSARRALAQAGRAAQRLRDHRPRRDDHDRRRRRRWGRASTPRFR